MTLKDIIFSSSEWWDIHHTWWCFIPATSSYQRKIIRPVQNHQAWCIRHDGDLFESWPMWGPKGDEWHQGCQARFSFVDELYRNHLAAKLEYDGDHAYVFHHRACALRSYLMYLVDMSIFVDKNAHHVDVVCLRYFNDFEKIHKYNWGLVWFTDTQSKVKLFFVRLDK